MNLLQYTSKEMFSSTELIRKSKKVFDKLNSKEIEKAVILRDGKPSFMLLDFETYENLIEEYQKLKEENSNKKIVKKSNTTVENIDVKSKEDVITEDIENIDDIDELNDDDLQEALAKIEQLDIDVPKEKNKEKDEHLKEFWE